MAQRRRFTQNKRQAARAPIVNRALRVTERIERPSPVVYGKPFIVFEDAEKNTFIYQAGQWVSYSASIAECRQTCQVKELPQRINGRIRYEIRAPEGRGA